jgi:hypothetical protein
MRNQAGTCTNGINAEVDEYVDAQSKHPSNM